MRATCWTFLLAFLLGSSATAQTTGDCWTVPPPVDHVDSARLHAALAPRSARAAHLGGPPPRIDGRLDDAAWCAALPATDFVQSRPNPGALATLPSAARVLFDDEAIYVAVRLWDPHPDSLVAPFPRRDDETTSDWVFVEIDSGLERRLGFRRPHRFRRMDGRVSHRVLTAGPGPQPPGTAADLGNQLLSYHSASRRDLELGAEIAERGRHRVALQHTVGYLGAAAPCRPRAHRLQRADRNTIPGTVRRGGGPVGVRGRRFPFPADLRHDRSDVAPSRLRAGGGRPIAGQPHDVRDLPPGAASTLRRRRRHLPVPLSAGVRFPRHLVRPGEPVLLPPDWTRAAGGVSRRRPHLRRATDHHPAWRGKDLDAHGRR